MEKEPHPSPLQRRGGRNSTTISKKYAIWCFRIVDQVGNEDLPETMIVVRSMISFNYTDRHSQTGILMRMLGNYWYIALGLSIGLAMRTHY